MAQIRIHEGFAGQKQWVLPGMIRDVWSGNAPLQALVPTDLGFYPAAKYLYREREQGAEDHVLIFCVAGEGWYEIDGQHLPLQHDEALVIPRDTPHVYGDRKRSPGRFTGCISPEPKPIFLSRICRRGSTNCRSMRGAVPKSAACSTSVMNHSWKGLCCTG